MKTLLVLIVCTALVCAGCVTGGSGQPTTQPSGIDPQTVRFFADLAVTDAIILAAGDPKLQPYIDAALKAKAELDNASPGAPDYQRYVAAVNVAAVTLLVETRKAHPAVVSPK